jgi:hypothetical protein
VPTEVERKGEQKVVDYAVAKGCLILKLNVFGRRGWPDRLFIYKGKVFFVEFKRVGEEPSKLQQEIHARIRQHGVTVYNVDKWADGIDIVGSITKEG